MILELLAKLRILKHVIVLQDFEGKEYITLKKKSRFGIDYAWVYPSYKIGHVILLENGFVHANSQACFIKRWKPYNQKKPKDDGAFS